MDQVDNSINMNYGKRIALSRSAPLTDSDSAIGEDYEDERSHKRAGGGKDKMNRNLSEKKRRDQFNMLVNELCTMVSTTNKKMDKSTVLKSTISFLKDHQETTDQAQEHEIKEDWKPSFLTNDEFMHLMLEACDSFLLVFTQHGMVLYASESVTSLLGHLPSDMVNRSIYEYVGKTESANLHNILYNYRVVSGNGVPEYENEENQLCFECNFRRGAIDSREPVQYEPVTVRGSFKHTAPSTDDGSQSANNLCNDEQVYFLCTVRLQTSQLVREMSIVDDNREFTSRHSLEWKFLFLDHRAPPIIGYLPFEVLGTSGYDYYHPDDLDGVTISHEQLMKTGKGTSCYYRFLTKGQQWIWLKTRFYITYHQWNSKPEFINCTNTVVSYADVRTQKRKDLGIDEEEPSPQDPAHFRPMFNTSRSPSVGSVTSGGRSESSFCPIDKDNNDISQHPTSTSQVRSRTVSQQLQQFLHRHLQQQQQQQQSQQTSMAACSIQSPMLQTTTVTSSYTSMPIQHIVHGRPQKPESPYLRILPRTATAPSNNGQQNVGQQLTARTATDTNSLAIRTSTPTLMTVSPINMSVSPPANIYMTPVQRQLHEQLRRKAGQVQDAILRQQEELRKIHQQLFFAEGTVPMLNSNSNTMLPLMGGDQQQQSLQSPPIPHNRQQQQQPQQGQSQQQSQSQQQQQQQQQLQQGMVVHRQSTEQSQDTGQMVPMHNLMVNQSSVLPFPMLPQDAEVYLSLSDTQETSLQKFSN